MPINIRKKKGYVLLETIISTVLTVLIFIVLVETSIFYLHYFIEIKENMSFIQCSQVLSEWLDYDIKHAETWNVNTDNNTIYFIAEEGQEVVYRYEDNQIQRNEKVLGKFEEAGFTEEIMSNNCRLLQVKIKNNNMMLDVSLGDLQERRH